MLFDEHVVVTYGEGDKRLKVAGSRENPSGKGNNCAIRVVQAILVFKGLTHLSLKAEPQQIRNDMHDWLLNKRKSDPDNADAIANSIIDDEYDRMAGVQGQSSDMILDEALSLIQANRFLSMQAVIRFFKDSGVFEGYSDVILLQYTSSGRRRYTCISNQFTRLSQGKPICIGVHLSGGHFYGIVHEPEVWQSVIEWGVTYEDPNIESYHEQVVISSDDEMPPAPPAPKADTLLQWGLSQDIVRAWVRNLRPEVRARLLRDARKWLQ